MNTTDKKNILLGSVIGVIPVIWAALIAAPYVTNGLLEHVDELSGAFRQPFQIRITENTLRTILLFLVIYAVSIGVWLSTRRNYRRGEEHGSARWGDPKTVNKRYADRIPENNKLLTQNVRIGLNGRKHRRNLNVMVMEMLRAGDVDEEDNSPSPLDNLFFDLEKTDPDHIALKYYRNYHSGAAKTLKSIQITLAARLEKFNLESLAKLTITDELDLPSLGERKTALFAIIPDNDTSFNFLVSILYTQLFQQLFHCADKKHDGSLPVHVHFVLDEFANLSMPSDFQKILSVMRSRNVSVSIILQNLAQLKALYEKDWESIMGNCDEFVYLGGNEQQTHKYVSELLGKETIDTNTYGRSIGRSGNYSTNYQNTGRELLLPNEVRMLDNRYAILFIRGERPIMDLKYDIMKHPAVGLTTDGGAEPYIHGQAKDAGPSIELVYDPELVKEATENAKLVELPETDYVLMSEEDVEKELL